MSYLKKIVSTVVCVAVILSLVPKSFMPVEASTSSDIWTDYTAISTAEELVSIRQNPAGKYYLTNDIVFSGNDFEIGGAFYNDGKKWLSFDFSGTFDGNGYSIIGLQVNNSNYAGLFACVENANIKNLTVEEGSVHAYHLLNSGTLSYAGGIAAYCVNTTFVNCTNMNTVYCDEYRAGGIAGYGENTTFINCYNGSRVRGDMAGGIIGEWYGGSITNCINDGKIVGMDYDTNTTYSDSICGGIVGRALQQEVYYTIDRCRNYGNIYTYYCAGGIIGQSGGYTEVSNCANSGQIYSEWQGGGIIGCAYSAINRETFCSVTSCYNDATVKSVYVGGIVGDVSNSVPLKITDCYNQGDIYGSGFLNPSYTMALSYAGGICGAELEDANGISIEYCYNIGKVTAQAVYKSGNTGVAFCNNTMYCYCIEQEYSFADNVVQCPLEEMQKQVIYEGFDFDNIWCLSQDKNNGFPYLKQMFLKEYMLPSLSEDSAAMFIGFLSDSSKLNEEIIKNSTWYQLMTNNYHRADMNLQAEALVLSAITITSAMADTATHNSEYLNKELRNFLEKEAGRHSGVSIELLNAYLNEGTKRLLQVLYDEFDSLLFPVDNLFGLADIYGAYSSVLGTVNKAKVFSERLNASVQAMCTVFESEKAGRYTYFASYLSWRGAFDSAEDEMFQTLMQGAIQVDTSNKYWFAKILDLFTWITGKESFNNHFAVLDEWAEYVYQLSCYVSKTDSETNSSVLTEEELVFTVSNSSATIISSKETDVHIIIPDSLGGIPVKEIGTAAFENCANIVSVKMGTWIESVGINAFKGCASLQSVVLAPNITTIGKSSFENCTSLCSIVLPSSVEFIDSDTFSGCPSNLKIICACTNTYVTEYCDNNNLNYVPIHTFGNYVSDQNATCSQYGTTTAKCDYCNAKKTIDDYSSLKEHLWDTGVVTKQPTSTLDGEHTYYCQLCTASQVQIIPYLSFQSAALTLYHNLAINYSVNKLLFEDIGYSNPYVVFEMNGSKRKIQSYTIQGDCIVFEFSDIAPDEMNDNIYATLYANYQGIEYASSTIEYSVATYCYNTLEEYSDDGNAKLRTLLVDLLNYGAKTQLYTGHKINELANSALTEEQLLWGTEEDVAINSVLNTAYETIDAPTVKWKGASLTLDKSVSMRFKFITDSVEGLSIKVKTDDNEWTIPNAQIQKDHDVYWVCFSELNVSQMCECVYLTVYNEETAVSNTVRYSIESYACEYQNSTDINLSELVKAMMRYGNSAYAYAH